MKIIDCGNGITQHTYPGGRFYEKGEIKVPSVTTVTAQLAKGPFFDSFLKTNGKEADAITKAAGIKGSIVHQATERLLREGMVHRKKDVFWNPDDEVELKIDESPDARDIWKCVQAFERWYLEDEPRIVAIEETFFLEKEGYAGTIDLVCYIIDKKTGKEDLWIIDEKSGKGPYKSHEIQVSAYKKAKRKYKTARLAILQVGMKTQKGWKLTEIQDCYPEFERLLGLWKFVTGGVFPDPPLEPPEFVQLPAERKLKRKAKSKKLSAPSVAAKADSKQAAG